MIAKTGEELLEICEKENIKLSEYAIRCEVEEKGLTREEVIDRMRKNLHVMKNAANEGREKEVYSVSGLIGGDGYKINNYAKKKTLTGRATNLAMAMALSSSEVNKLVSIARWQLRKGNKVLIISLETSKEAILNEFAFNVNNLIVLNNIWHQILLLFSMNWQHQFIHH